MQKTLGEIANIVEGKVVGDRDLIITGFNGIKDAEAGDLFWSHDYPSTYVDRYRYLNGPRASPAIDGGRVYTLGAQGVLNCFDLMTGHIYWQR